MPFPNVRATTYKKFCKYLFNYKTYLWALTAMLGCLGSFGLLLMAIEFFRADQIKLDGMIPTLATLGLAVICCPKIPLRAYERWGLGILFSIFT